MSCYNKALDKSVILVKTSVVGTHSNHLIEIFQMSTITNVFQRRLVKKALYFQGLFKDISRLSLILEDFSSLCKPCKITS